MSRPILYTFYRSSAAWRVRTALEIKQMEYESRYVDLKGKEDQLKDDYRALNSMAQVPTLLVDGFTLTQSLPIMEYLEETRRDQPSLLPQDPIKRQQARSIAEMVNSGIQPIQNLAVLKHLAKVTTDKSQVTIWAKHWVDRGLTAIEQVLEHTAGTYCVGEQVSIADITLVAQLYNAKAYEVDLSKFPLILGIEWRCSQLEAFRAAHPTAQADCPEEFKHIK